MLGEPREEARLHDAIVGRQAGVAARSSFEKNVSAAFVFVSCLPVQAHALVREEEPRLGGNLEGVRCGALRRQLENSRPVGVEPDLRDHAALQLRRLEVQLEDEDRSKDREVVEPESVRTVRSEERALLLREELLRTSLPERDILDRLRVGA